MVKDPMSLSNHGHTHMYPPSLRSGNTTQFQSTRLTEELPSKSYKDHTAGS